MSSTKQETNSSSRSRVDMAEGRNDEHDMLERSEKSEVGTSSRSDDVGDEHRKRRSRSGSKGRKGSHKRSSSGTGERRMSRTSPRRSASRSRRRISQGNNENSSEFAETSEHKRSRISPRRGKRSISPKSFHDASSQDSPTPSKRNSRQSAEVVSRGTDAAASPISPISKGSYNPTITSEIIISSWHSRSSSSSRSIGAEDPDSKPKAKSSKRSSRRSSKNDLMSPSGQSRSSVNSHNISPRRSTRASKPPEFVSPSGSSKSGTFDSRRSTDILYGDHDAKAKKRSSNGTQKRASKPGFELVSVPSKSSLLSTELLYGGDADTKAKAKAALKKSSSHSKMSNGTKSTVTETLYGDDDAKAKAKFKRSSSRSSNYHHNPGVERVQETESSDSHSSSSRSESPPPPMEGSVVTGIMIEASSNSFRANENAAAAAENIPDVVTPKKKRKSKRKQQRQTSYLKYIIIAIAILLLLGAGATAFIALTRDSEDTPTPSTPSTPDFATKPPTRPFGNGTPTSPPTKKKALDPPSPEECEAIRNNQTIPGQDSLPQKNLNVNIQINVKGETDMTDEMVQELLDAIQGLLIPSLVGCNSTRNDDQRRLVEKVPVIRGSIRKLQVVLDESRFAILYAYVKGEVREDVVCEETSLPDDGLCYMVLVEFTLYLDGDITTSELESIVYEGLENGNDFVSKLSLGENFRAANVRSITAVTPVDVPSLSPTDDPSGSPSNSPSKAASGASPTEVPVPKPVVNESPSPTDSEISSPSQFPSMALPNASPSSSPTLMPVVGPSPPPTVAPSKTPSTFPSIKPSTEPSFLPTVQASGVPSVMPSLIGSSAPSIPIPSSSPTIVPTKVPSPAPSMYVTSAPTPFPTSSQTSTPTHVPTTSTSVAPATRCYCTTPDSCDESIYFFSVGCGSCDSTGACTMLAMSENMFWDVASTIGNSSCTGQYACQHVVVTAIGASSCSGNYSCQNRIIDVQSGSCHGLYACAANPVNYQGGLVAGSNSCINQYACYSHELSVRSASCTSSWSCAGRTKMFVADGSCKARNACSGAVFSNGNIYQAQTQTSYIGSNSCTCEKCCTCMIRVVSGRCTTPGECCDVNFPTWKAAGVRDNTEEEMRRDLGVIDLTTLFSHSSSFITYVNGP